MDKIRKKKLNIIYENKFMNNIEEVKTLGWGSIDSQNKRFEVLLQILGRETNDSILDVGCGYGDVCVNIKNYVGIDYREAAIKKAKEKYPNKTFINCNLEEIKDKFDWVIASGIFCFNNDWKSSYVEEEIKKMFDICKKGVAFNLLSGFLQEGKDKDMKYAHPIEVIRIVDKITKKFTLRHDYLLNDMTVYLYK